MKVIFFASDNSSTSGAFLCMVRLEVLLRNIYSVDVITVLPEKGDGDVLLKNEGLKYTYIKSYNWVTPILENPLKRIKSTGKVIAKKILNVRAYHNTKKILELERPDYVHMNTLYGYVGAKAAVKLGIPVIWHLRESLEAVSLKIADKKHSYGLVNQAKKIVAVSEFIKNIYMNELHSNNIIKIYDGIDKRNFIGQREDILSSKTVHIIITGRISEHKGQIQAVKAMKILKDYNVPFELCMVGSGDSGYIKKIKSISREFGIIKNIHFYGKKSVQELSELYRKMDVALVCSTGEAFGRITIEAMMSGCLVIASNTGANSELIGNRFGYLYEFENVNDLAEKIRYSVIHKAEARKIAQIAQKRALDKFSDIINAKEIFRLYEYI